MDRTQQIRMKRKNRQLDKLTIGLLAAFGVVALITAILAFVVVRNLVNSWEMTDLPGSPQINADSNLPGGTGGEISSAPLQAAEGPIAEPWDGASRISVLVMGLDYRDWESGETPRTDTMILLTLDPTTRTAGMLSIPRDMWVEIPGFDHGKINTAYYLGEIYNLPGGGPGLAMETVESFLGVPIKYYAQVDFSAFVRFIDEIGGLKLNVPEEIKVDPIGPGNTVILEPGVQILPGDVTLAYARARYTEGGDFDRASRQQQVIMATRDQILSLNMLPTLITKAPKLYAEISSGISTNLSLDQVVRLANLAVQVDANNIKRGIIGPDVVMNGKSPDGLDILIPITDEIRLIRDDIFAETGSAMPIAALTDDPASLVQQEAARISLQNGTQTVGLAGNTAEYLRSQGINVVEETNADRIYESTTLIVYNGKPYTVQYLADMMGVSTSNIYNRYDPNAPVDVVVIIGNSWAYSNPMGQ